MNEGEFNALVDELEAILARHPQGAPAHAVHSASSLSPGVAQTVLALKGMRDDGLIQFSRGLYYPAGVEVVPVVDAPAPAEESTSGNAAEEPTMSRRNAAPKKGLLRERILAALTRPMTHDQIVKATGLDGKQVTNQLFLMRQAGLISGKRDGNVRNQKVWSRRGDGGDARATRGRRPAPPSDSDPVAAMLQRIIGQAQQHMDDYIVSVIGDDPVLQVLRGQRDSAQQALADHRASTAEA